MADGEKEEAKNLVSKIEIFAIFSQNSSFDTVSVRAIQLLLTRALNNCNSFIQFAVNICKMKIWLIQID